jgi:acetyl-CoA carboxylase alpha subunit
MRILGLQDRLKHVCISGENAAYFVAPPEFAASLTWRNPAQKHLAAKAMRVSAPEVLQLGCVDEIVAEPPGGAHTDPAAATELLKGALRKNLSELNVRKTTAAS